MHLVLSNGKKFFIDLYPCFTRDIILRWYKHLQHVDIPWRPWDYERHYLQKTLQGIQDDLKDTANKLGLQIDMGRLSDQQYLNELHMIYEQKYDGSQQWTDYHEVIHSIEKKPTGRPDYFVVNYRHLAGPLKILFQYNWLEYTELSIRPGTVFIEMDELGKSPHRYWLDNEPDNLERFNQLAKPWVWMRPRLTFALDQIDSVIHHREEFENWFDRYKKAWCTHWNIIDWTIENMHAKLPIGQVQDYQSLKKELTSSQVPCKIIL